MWNTSEMTDYLQFQTHHWHPAMQAKHPENPENHSRREERVVKTIF
jgi:hypothetical protein